MKCNIQFLRKLISRSKPEYPVPKIHCNNGLVLSVQAGKYLYCTPKEECAEWDTVEVGLPSRVIPELMKYAEDKDNPTQTVYGYVPIELVVDIINSNGGLDPAFLI